MSDEVSLNEGWTLQAYIAHNEAIRRETDRRHEQRFTAQTAAILKAETASERRFDGVNEFRATLSDQAATFISRQEVDQQIRSINEKVDLTASRMDRLEGRSGGMNSSWGYLLGGIVALGGILTILGGIIGAVIYITVNK